MAARKLSQQGIDIRVLARDDLRQDGLDVLRRGLNN